MSSGKKYSQLLALACIAAASGRAFATTPSQAIALAGNRLVADQTGLGSWPSESDFTGPSIAGLGDAYLVTGTSSYKNATFAGANFILTSTGFNTDPADASFLGDEAWGLAVASQISVNPNSNTYRSALVTFYNSTVPNGLGGTAGFTSRLVSDYTSQFGDQSEAVFYLAEHTAAAAYVNSPSLPAWRSALISTLGQVDDNDFFPVQAAGAALWALAQSGPLNGTVISNSGFWNGVTLAQLPAVVASREITVGSDAGAFYTNFTTNTLKDYTEDAVYDSLGLAVANPTLYASQVLLSKTWLANGVFTSLPNQGLYTDNPVSPTTVHYLYAGEALQEMTSALGVIWDGSVGSWSSTVHWSISPQVPNNGSPTAAIYDVTIPSGSVNLDVNTVIRMLTFTSGSLSGSSNLTVSGGTINGSYSLTGATTIVGGTLFIGGATQSAAAITGSGNLHINAGATLTSDGITVPNLAIDGTSVIRSSNTVNGTSKVSSLTIAGSSTTAGGWTGKLDLRDNALIILNPDPTTKMNLIATLKDQVSSGSTGLWTGTGITSSTIVGNANTTMAIVDNAELGVSAFRGQAGLDSNSVIVQQALLGDTNLSGKVDFADLLKVSQDFGHTGGWAAGNMDGDSTVDFGDLLLVAQHFGQTLALLPGESGDVEGASPAPVPEPTTLGMLALGGAMLLRRRDKRRADRIR